METSSKSPIVQLHNLHKNLRGKLLMNQISLSIPRGKITAVIGKSGAGKSILIKSIVGLFHPDSGQIFFHGNDLLHTSQKTFSLLIRKIGYLFQHAALFDFLTVEENIALPLREGLKLHSKKEIALRVRKSLEWVNLEGSQSMYPQELSGGMQKRVAVARTLVVKPELFLFDEPTTGLDPILTETIMHLITQVNRDFGISCVIISHDIYASCKISDYIAFIDNGRILFTGSPGEFLHSPLPEIQTMLSYTRIPT